MNSRLPRFKRTILTVPIRLTERDHSIIRLIHEHRFLRSSHIIALTGGSPQHLLRRLKLLYHHGYLERPRAQIDSYHKAGSRYIVYGLGNKGGSLLKREFGIKVAPVSWGEKNRAVGRIYLEHALLVSDFMVALTLACRRSSVRLLAERSIAPADMPSPFRWRVKINNRTKLGVIPDRVFALEFTSHNGMRERTWFFLEADRGTMPVMRRKLAQTSFYRKLLAYEATWTQSIHLSKFAFLRFRVLTITTSPARVQSLIGACSHLKRGHGLFLFSDQSILNNPNDILSAAWHTATPGVTDELLD
jgi:hypothetical protein